MKSMMLKFKAGFLILFLSAGFAVAQSEEWAFEVTPYLWAGGLTGEVEIAGQKTEFEKSASDLFDDLEFAGSFFAQAKKGRFLLQGRYDYYALSPSGYEVDGQSVDADFDSDILIGKVAAGYQYGEPGGVTTGLLLGIQSLRIENTISGPGYSNSESDDLFDLVLIVQPVFPLWSKDETSVLFALPMSIGGAVAGDSDLYYDVEAQLQYAFTEGFDFRLGYRVSQYEWEENSNNKLELGLAGWTFGAGFKW